MVLVLVFVLVACGPDQQAQAPAPEKPSLTPAEPTAEADDTSTLQVPKADPAIIDGVLASGEWDDKVHFAVTYLMSPDYTSTDF
jgi:hypothetical protein